MDNQSADFKAGYLRVISRLRRRNRAAGPWAGLQRFFYPRYTMLPRAGYLEKVIGFVAGRDPVQSMEDYREELRADLPLAANYRAAIASNRADEDPAERFANRHEGNTVTYYAMMRELRPTVVVETGTSSGNMTCLILAALNRNDHGKLISIDIPPVKGQLTMDLSVDPSEVGFMIPAEYRHRWEYIAGDAKEFLPQVLCANRVDVFIHDSLHTRTHMLYELHVARALLPEGAVIVSDDTLWNKAFVSFLDAHDLQGITCESNPNLGIAVNRFDEYEKALGTAIVKIPAAAQR